MVQETEEVTAIQRQLYPTTTPHPVALDLEDKDAQLRDPYVC